MSIKWTVYLTDDEINELVSLLDEGIDLCTKTANHIRTTPGWAHQDTSERKDAADLEEKRKATFVRIRHLLSEAHPKHLRRSECP